MVLFTEQARRWEIPFSPQDLAPGTSGDLAGHGWGVRYVLRQHDDGRIFLEYYASNRFVWGDSRVRIYADGSIDADLPTLTAFSLVRKGEDPDQVAMRDHEKDQGALTELRDVGLF